MQLFTKKVRQVGKRLKRRVQSRLFALGSSVECTFCGWTGFRFLPAGLRRDPNRLCPFCGSIERYRMLPLMLGRELFDRESIRILELAPKPCFRDYSKAQRGWSYVSSDLSSPVAMVRGDLREMPFATNSFDVIVCLHVMEHIHEDGAAFSEIARLLSPSGFGIIGVPLQGETTQEGAPPSEWLRLYGQDDHVRYYGMDVVQRMANAGLSTRTIDAHAYFSPFERRRYALDGDDRYIFVVRKEAR